MNKVRLSVQVFDKNRYCVFSFERKVSISELFEFGLAIQREYPDYSCRYEVAYV